MTGHGASVPPGMNAIKSLRRVSPLAIIFVALAEDLALTPSAHAQSSLATQLEPLVMWPGYAAKATPTGEVVVAPDNDADFTQRWERVTVNSSTFRFSRFGFNSCIRVPAGLSPSLGAPV